MSDFDLTNQFLIAMPSLGDPNFHHTVTYICAHNEEGAMGIVINRPTQMVVSEVLAQMSIDAEDPAVGEWPVYEGGPVQPDRGFIIHQRDRDWSSTIAVSDELAVSTSRDILEAMAQGEGPAQLLVALGYAGWGPGQLEQEIQDNAWLSCLANPEILFETPADTRWRAATALLGIDVSRLSTDVGHA